MRLHLALFYFYGLYYHWSKRATGTCALDKPETAFHVWVSMSSTIATMLKASSS